MLAVGATQSFIITGTVGGGSVCALADANIARVAYGCSTSDICLAAPIEARATLRTRPNLGAPQPPAISAVAAGLMTLEVNSDGPGATNVTVTDTLPTGLVYESLVSITPITASNALTVATAPVDGDARAYIRVSQPARQPTRRGASQNHDHLSSAQRQQQSKQRLRRHSHQRHQPAGCGIRRHLHPFWPLCHHASYRHARRQPGQFERDADAFSTDDRRWPNGNLDATRDEYRHYGCAQYLDQQCYSKRLFQRRGHKWQRRPTEPQPPA